MKVQALTALLFLLIAANEAKTMERCELAKTLKSHGMDGFKGYKLGDWVCMAQHESSYNTKAVGPPNKDGSRDYGIFQINSRYWCTDGKHPSKNVCKKPCSSFTNDDIKDDIVCAKTIVQGSQGMDAWVGWKNHCKGKDLSQYTRGCKLPLGNREEGALAPLVEEEGKIVLILFQNELLITSLDDFSEEFMDNRFAIGYSSELETLHSEEVRF
ncbi:UNVERIFIED_CONTAM: hypothetical protein K2H54_046921 [Gekko kuhli]